MRSNRLVCAIALAIANLSCSTPPPTGGLEPPPPTVSLVADPLVVTAPGTSDFTATVKNAVSCDPIDSWNVSSSGGTFTMSFGTAGSFTFTLKCRNAEGVTSLSSVTIVVNLPLIVSVRIIGAQPLLEDVPQGMKIKVERGSVVEEKSFDITGRVQFPHANEDSLCITIDAADTSNRSYYPSRACVKKINFSKVQTFVLIPFVWEGASVNLAEALDTTGTWPTAPWRSFFPWDATSLGISFTSKTWPEEKLPVTVAYNRSQSTGDISSFVADSIRVIITQLNLKLGKSRTGKDFFKHVDLLQGELFDGISLAVDSTVTGGTFSVTGSSGYSLISGSIRMRRFSDLLQPGFLEHELVHGLGVGHTQRWLSLMNNNPGFCGTFPGCVSPTPKDILYIRLLHRVREIRLKYNAQYEIPEADPGL